jgi:hypothetical protein
MSTQPATQIAIHSTGRVSPVTQLGAVQTVAIRPMSCRNVQRDPTELWITLNKQNSPM